jgi:hypothetical protein
MSDILRCEVRGCRTTTSSGQQGLLAGDGWRIERVGAEMVIVCPRHNWRANGILVANEGTLTTVHSRSSPSTL